MMYRGGGRDGLVAVISYGLWQRRFGGAANVVGAALPVEGVPCTIVGVMPPDFFGVEVGQPFDVILPLAIEPAVRGRARVAPSSERTAVDGHASIEARAVDRERDRCAPYVPVRDCRPERGRLPRGTPEFLTDPYVLVPAATGTSDRSGLRRQYSRPLMTVLGVVGSRPAGGVRERRQPLSGPRNSAPPRNEHQAGARGHTLAPGKTAAGGEPGRGADRRRVRAAVRYLGEPGGRRRSVDGGHASIAGFVPRLARDDRDRGHRRRDSNALRHGSG